jgi:hypothetical protein
MKLLITYLSLLIFSGLIIPVCTSSQLSVKTLLARSTTVRSHQTISSFFYTDIIQNIFPVLKSLN